MHASSGKQEVILPKTFVQRGIAVPFSTRVLTFARLRRQVGGSMEILIPGLTGGADVYVVPHKMLPDAITMTVHDRAMHEEITRIRKLSPATVKAAAQKIALTGLGGPDPAAKVRKSLEAEKNLGPMVVFGLIRIAIQQLAPNHPGVKDLNAATIMSPEGMKLSRDALGGYAQTIGERGDKIWSRLEDWASRIADFGAPDESALGYLGTRLHQVEEMAQNLANWVKDEPVETAEIAQRISNAAETVSETARIHVASLNDMAGKMDAPLKDYDQTAESLTHHIDQIGMILDGWSRISDMWQTALLGDRILQREVLESFAPYVPVIPIEAVGQYQTFWETFRKRQIIWQRGSQHNLGDDIGSDAQEKLGQFRKEPA